MSKFRVFILSQAFFFRNFRLNYLDCLQEAALERYRQENASLETTAKNKDEEVM